MPRFLLGMQPHLFDGRRSNIYSHTHTHAHAHMHACVYIYLFISIYLSIYIYMPRFLLGTQPHLFDGRRSYIHSHTGLTHT